MKTIVSPGCVVLSVALLALATLLPAKAESLTKAEAPAGVPAQCMGTTAVLPPPFNVDYSCLSLGSVPGVPTNYGGLTLKYNDPNILLIGGSANNSSGRIYQIGVVRGTGGHINGFTGTATLYPAAGSTIGLNIDGGLVFGPGNILFIPHYPSNDLEESKPGSIAPDKIVNLSSVPGGSGTASLGSLGFVPAGFPGAGQMKLVSYNGGGWFTAAFAPDGNGTYDITSITAGPVVGGGPEGIGFVPLGSPVIPPNSALIAQYGAGKVITVPLDANGDPVMANAQDFVTGLTGVEGTFIDPVTGDLLFSTYGGANQVIRVIGFGPAPVPTAAVSRKTHGSAGPFDIDLLSASNVECRNGTPTGQDFTAVVTFANSISASGATVTSIDSLATADAPIVSGATATVNLHNVANAQRLRVILTNVNDGMHSGDVFIFMNLLIGDTNNTGGVSAADIGQTKAQSGQTTNGTNFRTDANASGSISAADIGLVKSKSGTALP